MAQLGQKLTLQCPRCSNPIDFHAVAGRVVDDQLELSFTPTLELSFTPTGATLEHLASCGLTEIYVEAGP